MYFKRTNRKGYISNEYVGLALRYIISIGVILIIAVLSTILINKLSANVDETSGFIVIKKKIEKVLEVNSDMMFDENKYKNEYTTFDNNDKIVTCINEESVIKTINKILKNGCYPIFDTGTNNINVLKDKNNRPFLFSYDLTNIENDSYACMVINSTGENGINDSENLAHQIISEAEKYEKSFDIVRNVDVNDDIGIVFWIKNGEVTSTVY